MVPAPEVDVGLVLLRLDLFLLRLLEDLLAEADGVALLVEASLVEGGRLIDVGRWRWQRMGSLVAKEGTRSLVL